MAYEKRRIKITARNLIAERIGSRALERAS
jgi:hypothetical protein